MYLIKNRNTGSSLVTKLNLTTTVANLNQKTVSRLIQKIGIRFGIKKKFRTYLVGAE